MTNNTGTVLEDGFESEDPAVVEVVEDLPFDLFSTVEPIGVPEGES